jgi:Ca2+-binding EF-hand superfamily protein
MESINLDQTHPKIYKIINELDNSENKNGLNYESFMSQVNERLGNLNSRDGIRKVFDQFLENPRDSTITLNSLRNVTRELGETVNTEELRDILSKASKNGNELTYDEFYSIMMKMA